MRHRIDKAELDTAGYVLSTFPLVRGFTDVTVALSRIVTEGNDLGQTVGCTDAHLEAKRTMLEVHSECIYEDPVLHYFAVAALKNPIAGGEVPVYDARKAAETLSKNNPDLASVRITYQSDVYKGKSATHAVVSDDPDYGPVVRIRMTPRHNRLSGLPASWTEEDFYKRIQEVLDESISALVPLNAGTVLYLNNRITLHAQRPYVGRVHYLRVRFDDPNNVFMHI